MTPPEVMPPNSLPVSALEAVAQHVTLRAAHPCICHVQRLQSPDAQHPRSATAFGGGLHRVLGVLLQFKDLKSPPSCPKKTPNLYESM